MLTLKVRIQVTAELLGPGVMSHIQYTQANLAASEVENVPLAELVLGAGVQRTFLNSDPSTRSSGSLGKPADPCEPCLP